ASAPPTRSFPPPRSSPPWPRTPSASSAAGADRPVGAVWHHRGMLLRIYLDVLRTPSVARLLSSAVVGRMPTAMAGLALVLLVREGGGSYAVAGMVAGAYSMALALTSPLLGRLVDRVGQTRVLVGCAVASAVAFVALAAAGSA